MKNFNLVVIGPAGVGKSTFTASLLQECKDFLWCRTRSLFFPCPMNIWNMYRHSPLDYSTEMASGRMLQKDCDYNTFTFPLAVASSNGLEIFDFKICDIPEHELSDDYFPNGILQDYLTMCHPYDKVWRDKKTIKEMMSKDAVDAIILMIDPSIQSENKYCTLSKLEDARDILNNFITLLRKEQSNINLKNIPIAVVMNKSELLTEEEWKKFDFSKYKLDALLSKFKNFQRFHVYCVDPDKSFIDYRADSRTLDSFLWILKEKNIIKEYLE